MNSHTWTLTDFDVKFFNGDYASYEDSMYLNTQTIVELKDKYIKGNTALINELTRIIFDNIADTTYVVGKDKYMINHSIILHNNVIVVHELETGTTETFKADTSFENLKNIVNWIVNNENLPIYVIDKIYNIEKIIYQN